MEKKQRVHFVSQHIISPTEPISVNVVGCGGTGSIMLSNLAVINKALIALGHPGISVTAWDDDKVTEANIARQLFYENDIGQYKAAVLINRINRAFGTHWESVLSKIGDNIDIIHQTANVTISCVDTVKSRIDINKILTSNTYRRYDYNTPYYWIDCGNSNKFGQVYVGTLRTIEQPNSKVFDTTTELTSPYHYFKDQVDSKNDGPSCSLAEALGKQDLFINRTVATYASNLFWNMFRTGKLMYRGIYINLDNYSTNPIKL